jgi:hypothetical protein
MSEPIPACISIGGKVPTSVVQQLCEAIQREGLALEWGDGHFEPQTAAELLDACQEMQGIRVLWLCDDQANWGRFSALEAFLAEHDIPFDLQSDGKFEYSPELIAFRPGGGPVRIFTSPSGEPVISAALLTPIKTALEAAMNAGMQKDHRGCLAQLEMARGALRNALPPEVPPLAPFSIG